MNLRPIINIRNQLSWYHRLYSDASTLALWSAWLWLCRPAILAAIGMLGVTFFGLFLTPVFYVLLRTLEKQIERVRHHEITPAI